MFVCEIARVFCMLFFCCAIAHVCVRLMLIFVVKLRTIFVFCLWIVTCLFMCCLWNSACFCVFFVKLRQFLLFVLWICTCVSYNYVACCLKFRIILCVCVWHFAFVLCILVKWRVFFLQICVFFRIIALHDIRFFGRLCRAQIPFSAPKSSIMRACSPCPRMDNPAS